MCTNVGAGMTSFLHDGRNFAFGELQTRRRIESKTAMDGHGVHERILQCIRLYLEITQAVRWGGHTPRGHDLDVVRPLAQLLPRGHPHFSLSVAHSPQAQRRTAAGLPVLAAQPHVAMAARLRQRTPAEQHARSCDGAFVHGLLHGSRHTWSAVLLSLAITGGRRPTRSQHHQV